MQNIKLPNGITMPVLGFGTYQIPPEHTAQAVADAISAGYRLIDTAQVYLNETEVGQGIRQSGIAREEIFLTTKVWVDNAGEAASEAALLRSFERLGVDYLDLVLVHQGVGDYYGTWRTLEKFYQAGKIRAIGVSNFSPDRLVDLAEFNQIKPMVNQIELHPFHQRTPEINELQQENVIVQAWAPFAEGRNDIFHNPILTAIAQQHQKSVAQVILRWLVEQKIAVLSKSTRAERMRENLAVFDFSLTPENKTAIATLDLGKTLFRSGTLTDRVRFLKSVASL